MKKNKIKCQKRKTCKSTVKNTKPKRPPQEVIKEIKGTANKNLPTQIQQFIIKKVNGQRRKVGVLIGRKDEDGYVRIGWSKVNLAEGDSFDPKYAVKLATERTHAKECIPIPPSIIKDALHFQNRCIRYFKDAMGQFKISEKQWKYVLVEGLKEHNRFFSPYSGGDARKLADGTVAYKVLGYASTVEEAQKKLYGRTYPRF